MKIKEIREKSESQLQKMLSELRNKLREVRFKVASKQHKNYKELREIKQAIARVLTVINERRLAHLGSKGQEIAEVQKKKQLTIKK